MPRAYQVPRRMRAAHTARVDVRAFVETHLPRPPARVLEVGCGRGDLARTLAGIGHDVVAIDPDAPDGDIFRAVSLEDFGDPGPFDAIVAVRSLHHLHDATAAVAKIARLLRPGGLLVVHEHAWERFDGRTDRWYVEQRGSEHGVEGCLRDWVEDHRELHTAAAMRAALDRRFEQRAFAWTPYLYEGLGPAVTREHEQHLIETGRIAATGFAYVGERAG